MGLLDRVSTLVRANLNDLLERAEDPEKVVKQLILDMNNQLIQVRTQVAAAIADERKLQRLWDQNDGRATDWQLRAEKAVTAGNDELAKQCLSRVLTYREISDGFRHQYEVQSSEAEKLRAAFHQLEAKIQAAEARKDLLIARARQAKAREQIQKATSQAAGVAALSDFQRLENRVYEAEARADALIELEGDSVETRIEQIEQDEQVAKQLAELKQRLLPPSSGH